MEVILLPVKSEFLRTARLEMKAMCPEDADRAMDLLTHPDISKTYMLPEFSCREESRNLFERLMRLSLKEDCFLYGIYLHGELIGWINETENTFPSIEVGYVIHPAFQNRGYATEALQASIAELFRMGYACIRAGFFSGNTPSRRVMEKSGMHPNGESVEITYRNSIQTCILFEIQKPA